MYELGLASNGPDFDTDSSRNVNLLRTLDRFGKFDLALFKGPVESSDPRCCSRVRPVWQRKLGEAAPVPRRVARRLQRVLQLAEQPQRGRAAAGEAAVGGRAPWAAGAGDQQVQKVRHSAAGGHGPVVHGPLSDVLTPPVPKQIEAQLRVGTLIVTLGASTGTRELLSSSSTGINRTRTSKATLTERPAPNQPSPASPSPAGSGCWRAPCCGHHAGISMSRV